MGSNEETNPGHIRLHKDEPTQETNIVVEEHTNDVFVVVTQLFCHNGHNMIGISDEKRAGLFDDVDAVLSVDRNTARQAEIALAGAAPHLGDEGAIAMQVEGGVSLSLGRIHPALDLGNRTLDEALGIARAAYEYALDYAKERHAFDGGESFQAMMKAELRTAQQSVDEIAKQVIAGMEAVLKMDSPYPAAYQEVVYQAARFSPGSGFDELLTAAALDEILQRLRKNGTL